MNKHVEDLLQVRAAVHGCRAILKQIAAGDHEACPVAGGGLAEYAENSLNAIIEAIPGRA